MFLCRVISIFLLFYTTACGSVTAKNISQENIETKKEKLCRPDVVSKVESEPNNEFFSDTDYSLTCSGEGYEESNATISNDSLFDDDRYGHVIEKFINEMEAFWQGVKVLIADENNKTKSAGNWWHGDTENKYLQMKELFYQNVPKDLPQKVKDIINEYEMRYNDLMWSEIENIIINQDNHESIISESVPSSATNKSINKKAEDHNNMDNRDSIDDKKCKKMSFEDVFQVKITKSGDFSAIK